MTATEHDTRAFLMLPAGYGWHSGHSKGSKLHITFRYDVGICGISTTTLWGLTAPTAPVERVCRKCMRVAQKKGLGVRYE